MATFILVIIPAVILVSITVKMFKKNQLSHCSQIKHLNEITLLAINITVCAIVLAVQSVSYITSIHVLREYGNTALLFDYALVCMLIITAAFLLGQLTRSKYEYLIYCAGTVIPISILTVAVFLLQYPPIIAIALFVFICYLHFIAYLFIIIDKYRRLVTSLQSTGQVKQTGFFVGFFDKVLSDIGIIIIIGTLIITAIAFWAGTQGLPTGW